MAGGSVELSVTVVSVVRVSVTVGLHFVVASIMVQKFRSWLCRCLLILPIRAAS